MQEQVTLEKIVALCKRRGLVYQSAEIYGGLNGVYDIGPVGVLIKQNIIKSWVESIKHEDLEILFIEGAILAPEIVWQASQHLENFQDPMVDCLNCKHRFRADEIDILKACINCSQNCWTPVRSFNLMFKTHVGAASDNANENSIAYLRPETAQSIFVNFKNIMSSNRVKIPFGVAQVGKAFRNEITPKQFLFRVREFEQMELEWFCKEQDALKFFDFWCNLRFNFYNKIGLNKQNIAFRKHTKEELSHYSSCTSDIEYNFPFGFKELEGIAYRGNFDLSQHQKYSGKDLSVFDEETKKSYIPHVIECSIGVGRLFLALLCDAYKQEIVKDAQDGSKEDNQDIRIVLKLSPNIAPYKAAFMPLSKQLTNQTYLIYNKIKNKYNCQFDDSGSIGKRYRRQDEIGTPLCFTYDFQSLTDGCITVRDRDTMKQERISIENVEQYIMNRLKI